MHIAHSNLLDTPSPLFCEGRKLAVDQKALIWEHLQDNPQIPSRVLLNDIAQTHRPIDVSVGHLNKIRKQWNLNGPKGRPVQEGSEPARESGSVIEVIPHMSQVGVHLFDEWMEHHNGFEPVIQSLELGIQNYIQGHPEDEFPLLLHREETLKNRFKAIFYAPLFGIGKLSECDYKEHSLETLLARGFQSSTLNQFLGQLERIDAGKALMPALLPAKCGKTGYIDGHLIAFWTSVSMHKGKITNVGRIMPGSCAVIAHDEEGQALFVQYVPPDIRLTHLIVEYCQNLSKKTGICVFVIDREVNDLKISREFRDRELGLLCMLDSNQYKGLESFETSLLGSFPDGSLLYKGVWKEAKEEDDPRIFVIVEEKETEKVLVYWGTPKVEEEIPPKEWPAVYRKRSEVQENSFKSMMEHGALDVNFGNKKIWVSDRHQQRKKEEIEEDLAKARETELKKGEAVKEKQEKVEESEEKGHKKRLLQRQAGLAKAQEDLGRARSKKEEIEKKLEAVGEEKQRADRDFRKQLIMTFRTLFLENALVSYLFALLGHINGTISLQTLLSLFFDRSGGKVETQSQIIYWVNPYGLSCGYQKTLGEVVKGINAMGLKREGKLIQVRIRAGPT